MFPPASSVRCCMIPLNSWPSVCLISSTTAAYRSSFVFFDEPVPRPCRILSKIDFHVPLFMYSMSNASMNFLIPSSEILLKKTYSKSCNMS
ncbi:hypothetical protein M9Y10_039821 [Tritrichomonas musculus]|uniref:Secreted protein n=1 Tax=Tritrichomonas musculus TaxID=1915356 RepID=A0ABR2GQG7_9EUKA